MLRKVLYCWFSLLFNLSLAHATTWENLQPFKWPTCIVPQNEWRFGVGIGVEYLNLQAKVKDDFSPFGAVQFGDRDQTQKHFQVSPSLEIGKTSCNNYYTGLVVSWHYSGIKKESRAPLKLTTYFTHQFKMAYYLDVLAKLGYKVTSETMAYMLVGPSMVKWSHTTKQITEQTLEDTFKMSQTSIGLGVGLGVEQVIGQNVALSINYTHHFYKNEKKQKIMSIIDNVGYGPFPRSGIISKKITPSSDAITLRLTYFF
ncbi:hypothetical protein IM40_08790 [Candidatus Paracaedimonas acanthamoebae]|nr:hypothetical protein IM40_08790 [Candidatus Paracaedimonas acanthamoebae]